MPKVIHYDKDAGLPTDEQVMAHPKGVEGSVKHLFLWKEWHASAVAQNLDLVDSDKASITMVLRSLYSNGNFAGQPLDILIDPSTGRKTVVAIEDIAAKALQLHLASRRAGKSSR